MKIKTKKPNFLFEKTIWISVSILLGGFVVFLVPAIKLDDNKVWNNVFTGVGTTFISIGAVSLIHDYFTKRDLLSTIDEILGHVLEKHVPNNYKKLNKAGISDAFVTFNIEKFVENISHLKNDEIKIMKIWIPNLNHLWPELKDAIEKRNCKVRIILLSDEATEAIKRRAQAMDLYDVEDINHNIKYNIKILTKLHDTLDEKYRKNFELRTHDSFISVSLMGYSSQYWVGFYLRPRMATKGIIMEVKGATTSYYREFNQHFEEEWKTSSPMFNQNETPIQKTKELPQHS